MSTDPAVDLSVVIPAYNEGKRLPRTLERVLRHLEADGRRFEVVVVDDGSRDDTATRAAEAGPWVSVVRNPGNRGKGYSVRQGMLRARGARRLMTDADLSTPIEDLALLERKMDEGFAVAIASRALPGSNVEVHQSRYRELMGRLFNALVRLLALPDLKDTQCGFKLFTAEAAQDAFGPARLDGFGFDVEALFLARKRGHRIAEVPVTWRNDAASHVGAASGFRAFVDVLRVRLNDGAGRYEALAPAAQVTESPPPP